MVGGGTDLFPLNYPYATTPKIKPVYVSSKHHKTGKYQMKFKPSAYALFMIFKLFCPLPKVRLQFTPSSVTEGVTVWC